MTPPNMIMRISIFTIYLQCLFKIPYSQLMIPHQLINYAPFKIHRLVSRQFLLHLRKLTKRVFVILYAFEHETLVEDGSVEVVGAGLGMAELFDGLID